MSTSSILPIRELDDLVLSYLDFFALRRLNQVNRHYRDKLNQQFRQLVEKQSHPSEQLPRMVRAKNLGAAQWLLARPRTAILHLDYQDLVQTNSVEFLQWGLAMRDQGRISISLSLASYGECRFLEYLWPVLLKNNLAMLDCILTWLKGQSLDRSREPNHPLLRHLGSCRLATVQWIDQYYRSIDQPINWREKVEVRARKILRSQDVELMEWFAGVAKFDWPTFLAQEEALLPYGYVLPTELGFYDQIERQYGWKIPEEAYFTEALERGDSAWLTWLLARGYAPPLTIELLETAASHNSHLLALIYHSSPPQPALLRALLSTQARRFPPYKKAVYRWISTILTS